jgi:tetratricopeptide (TPR) repeat protein
MKSVQPRSPGILALVVLVSIMVAGCSSSKFRVKTDPDGAKVYYENTDSKERRLLGQTPLEMTYKDINSGSSPFFALVINKEGFEERRVLVPDVLPFRSGGDVKLDISLKKSRDDGPQNIDGAVWNDAIELLFDAQKLALAKNYEPAVTKVNTAIKKTGGFHKAYSLLGSIYFLMKDYRKSLKNWEIAAKLNTRDSEATRMIKLLKGRIQMGKE